MTNFKHLTEIVKYGEEGYSGPSDITNANDAKSILSDWNRYLKASKSAGGTNFEFYIGNQTLAEARGKPYNEFESIDALRKFFKDKLFPNHPDNEDTDELITTALCHFNQGGLPTATYKSINAKNVNDKSSSIMISEPSYKITFIPIKEGVRVVEEDTYKDFYENVSPPVKHNASEIYEEFFAKTTTEYLLNNDRHVLLMDCNVECNSRDMEYACFHQPSFEERMFNFFTPFKSDPKPGEHKVVVLYRPNEARSAHQRDNDDDDKPNPDNTQINMN